MQALINPPISSPVHAVDFNNISKRAMLAALKISCWSGRKHDKEVSQEVADQHGSNVKLGEFRKMIVVGEAAKKLKLIKTLDSAMRADFYKQTHAWTDDGSRVLVTSNYPNVCGKFKKYEYEREDLVKHFIKELQSDAHKEEAKQELGSLYREEDYPSSIKEIEKAFHVEFGVLPFPTSNDVRLDISEHELKRVRADIDRVGKKVVEDANRNTLQRIKEVVSTMFEKLTAYENEPDPSNPKKRLIKGKFHDTLVTNIQDVVNLVPLINITGDPEMDKFARDIEDKLCVYSPETLREDPAVREQVANEADEIVKLLDAYI